MNYGEFEGECKTHISKLMLKWLVVMLMNCWVVSGWSMDNGQLEASGQSAAATTTSPVSSSSPPSLNQSLRRSRQRPRTGFGWNESQHENAPLPADKAFVFSVALKDNETLLAHWDIAEKYYLYSGKIQFRVINQGIKLGDFSFPPGKIKEDEFFGKVQIYHGSLSIALPFEITLRGISEIILQTRYQGCAERGICYPPIVKTIPILLMLPKRK